MLGHMNFSRAPQGRLTLSLSKEKFSELLKKLASDEGPRSIHFFLLHLAKEYPSVVEGVVDGTCTHSSSRKVSIVPLVPLGAGRIRSAILDCGRGVGHCRDPQARRRY